MGMDLCPVAPSEDAPTDENSHIWGRYNWNGWRWLVEHLNKWGVDTIEFSGFNDGDLISEETCKKVADAIEKNLHTLDEEDQTWLKEDIILWRTCGGYYQY